MRSYLRIVFEVQKKMVPRRPFAFRLNNYFPTQSQRMSQAAKFCSGFDQKSNDDLCKGSEFVNDKDIGTICFRDSSRAFVKMNLSNENILTCNEQPDPAGNIFNITCDPQNNFSTIPTSWYRDLFPAGMQKVRYALAGDDAIACSDVPPTNLRPAAIILFIIVVIFAVTIALLIGRSIWSR